MKPLLSREGSNVVLMKDGKLLAKNGGAYGHSPYIVQELAVLPEFNSNYPLVGSWVIGDKPCGIGIRESKGMITDDTSRFVPHIIRG